MTNALLVIICLGLVAHGIDGALVAIALVDEMG